jgi:hypothetical protein
MPRLATATILALAIVLAGCGSATIAKPRPLSKAALGEREWREPAAFMAHEHALEVARKHADHARPPVTLARRSGPCGLGACETTTSAPSPTTQTPSRRCRPWRAEIESEAQACREERAEEEEAPEREAEEAAQERRR